MEFIFVAVALWGIALAIFLCVAAFQGAVLLFAFAAEQQFVGLAAYVACWVFLLPFMLVASVLFGLVHIMMEGKEGEERQIARPQLHEREERGQQGRGSHIKEPADVWKDKPASVA